VDFYRSAITRLWHDHANAKTDAVLAVRYPKDWASTGRLARPLFPALQGAHGHAQQSDEIGLRVQGQVSQLAEYISSTGVIKPIHLTAPAKLNAAPLPARASVG
jgi:hypothetical protein